MATGRIGVTPNLRTRWSKAPAGGTTSLSGLDDNSVSLVYDAGFEAVYRNGVLLSRGNDYTATNGTTITLIDATIAGDIIEVFANQAIPLTSTYTQAVADAKFINNSLVDAKGDIIAATAADTVARLAVGTNNQVLMVDSGQATGLKYANEATATLTTTGDTLYASAANTLARLGIGTTGQVLTVSGGLPVWATPSSGSMTVISSGTLSGSSLSLTSIPSTYNDLRLVIRNYDPSADQSSIFLNFNNDTTANRYKDVTNLMSTDNTQNFGDNRLLVGTQGNDDTANQNLTILTVGDYANATTWKFISYDYLAPNYSNTANLNYANRRGYYNQTAAISSIQLTTVSQATGTPGTFSGGTYILYGVK